jgi:hypothetical protein
MESIAAIALAVLVGCSGKETDTEPDYEGDDAGECSDEADNDRDGLFDCDDDGCSGSPECSGEDPGDTGESGDTGAGGDTGTVDSSCLSQTPQQWQAASVGVQITGSSDEANELSDLLGWSVAVCDLNQDGLDDAVITSPNGGSSSAYSGQVGVFWGPGDSWNNSLSMQDADVLIEGHIDKYLGSQATCGDVDGDGAQDLLVGRTAYDMFIGGQEVLWSDVGLLIYSGTSLAGASNLDETDADLSLTFDPGQDYFHAYSTPFWVADIDADGEDEVMLYMKADKYNGLTQAPDADGKLWVLDNLALDAGLTEQPMEDYVSLRIAGDGDDALSDVQVIPDQDGDGSVDIFFGQGDLKSGSLYPGEANFLGSLPAADSTIAAGERLALLGAGDDMTGWQGAFGDFDGDGSLETVLSSPGLDGNKGGLYVFFEDPSLLNTPSGAASDLASHRISGISENSYFGWELEAVGDVDGDGKDDLLATEVSFYDNSNGAVHILSGACLDGSMDNAADAALMSWTGEEGASYFGSEAASGDIDGDGSLDVVMGSFEYNGGQTFPPGRVYIHLSSR